VIATAMVAVAAVVMARTLLASAFAAMAAMDAAVIEAEEVSKAVVLAGTAGPGKKPAVMADLAPNPAVLTTAAAKSVTTVRRWR
jgi:hypothetical protein